MKLFYEAYVLLLALEFAQEQHRRLTHGKPSVQADRFERIRRLAYRRYQRRNPYR